MVYVFRRTFSPFNVRRNVNTARCGRLNIPETWCYLDYTLLIVLCVFLCYFRFDRQACMRAGNSQTACQFRFCLARRMFMVFVGLSVSLSICHVDVLCWNDVSSNHFSHVEYRPMEHAPWVVELCSMRVKITVAKGQFWGENGRPVVKYNRDFRPYAAAMRPFCQITLTTSFLCSTPQSLADAHYY